MSEIVTGTPAVVGFTSGYNGSYNHGWSDKDTTRFEAEHLRDAIAANSVAIEKTGAANSLAVEKIGAAALLTAEKIGSAAVMATHDQSHQLSLQICAMQAEMQKCCCDLSKDVAEVKATVLSSDANRIRDALQQTQVELLMLKQNGHHGS